MPRYDFRCDDCGNHFELTRSFSQSSELANCPRDGAEATRLFSPPLDVLVYNREPVVSTGRVSIPPGALSCHDHGPPPGEERETHGPSGSSWHARGYDDGDEGQPELGHSHAHGHAHAHGHGHSHSH